jgi:hypothetical protein
VYSKVRIQKITLRKPFNYRWRGAAFKSFAY